MQQGQQVQVRPPQFLRVEERSSRAMHAVTDGAAIPPRRKTQYRKWRSSGDKPSPVERVTHMIVELHACGVSVATLRRIPQTFSDLLDDLSCGKATPRLTSDALVLEGALEASENALALRVALGDRTPETLRAFADAARNEAFHQLELARAADAEARATERGAR